MRRYGRRRRPGACRAAHGAEAADLDPPSAGWAGEAGAAAGQLRRSSIAQRLADVGAGDADVAQDVVLAREQLLVGAAGLAAGTRPDGGGDAPHQALRELAGGHDVDGDQGGGRDGHGVSSLRGAVAGKAHPGCFALRSRMTRPLSPICPPRPVNAVTGAHRSSTAAGLDRARERPARRGRRASNGGRPSLISRNWPIFGMPAGTHALQSIVRLNDTGGYHAKHPSGPPPRRSLPARPSPRTTRAGPVTIVVPFAAGGPTDTVTRLIAEPMSAALGQQIVVQNVAGAGGTLGRHPGRQRPRRRLHRADAPHRHVDRALALRRPRLRPARPSFAPVGLVTNVPMTIIARKDFEPNTLAELIDYVKANADTVTYANAGIGAASHLCGMLFMDAIDTQLTTVPYQGTGPAMTDLLGGQVDFMCDQTTNTTGQIQGGEVKAYAVTTARAARHPARPADHRRGRLPDFQVGVWHGLYAPAGTPDDGDRQADRGAAGRARRTRTSSPASPSSAPPRCRRAGDAGGARRPPHGADRALAPDHRGGRGPGAVSRRRPASAAG